MIKSIYFIELKFLQNDFLLTRYKETLDFFTVIIFHLPPCAGCFQWLLQWLLQKLKFLYFLALLCSSELM